jgi:hypothetical protein
MRSFATAASVIKQQTIREEKEITHTKQKHTVEIEQKRAYTFPSPQAEY